MSGRAEQMLDMPSVVDALSPLGFERVELLHGSTFKDCSTIQLVPSRGLIDPKVIGSWIGLIAPMNQKRWLTFTEGDEVGHAYTEMVGRILKDPYLSKWKYIMTMEDDNLPPPDAHIRLLETIDWGGYDAVSGLYFTKGDWNMPMAYGDPAEYARTGVLTMQPRDVAHAVEAGTIMEVNGIGMGCALWRMDLFREIDPPWFVTVNDIIPDKGIMAFTQDLYFCERARRVGKRFAVDMRVRVGHMDVETGVVY